MLDRSPHLQNRGAEHRPAARGTPTPRGVLAVVPAHNEARSLPGVIAEIRAARPDFVILVVDDGSTDGSAHVAATLGVRWLRFDERLGVGAAVRAGLRYARRHHFAHVVRLDGDGQHGAEDAATLVEALDRNRVDVAFGSRFTTCDGVEPSAPRRAARRLLAAMLSVITRDRVTDPTSGFCAFGPRAVDLLADHHPTGYPEPELRLFLRTTRLRVAELPVSARPRTAGRTTLTTARLWLAAARVVLAMIVVPLRTALPYEHD